MNIEANVLLGKREEFYFEFCRNFQIYWILEDKIDQRKSKFFAIGTMLLKILEPTTYGLEYNSTYQIEYLCMC